MTFTMRFIPCANDSNLPRQFCIMTYLQACTFSLPHAVCPCPLALCRPPPPPLLLLPLHPPPPPLLLLASQQAPSSERIIAPLPSPRFSFTPALPSPTACCDFTRSCAESSRWEMRHWMWPLLEQRRLTLTILPPSQRGAANRSTALLPSRVR